MSGMGLREHWLLKIMISLAYVFSTKCVVAQITPDRTLPNNSNVTINGSVFNITGGTQAGRNLFHSFQQFSVPTGSTASFNNGLDIQNIFSRVTGGTISNIEGIIKASGSANLFFINPSGIVFGHNASLNVGGSFVATTANAIQFGNQGTFSASVPNNPALLTINPTALFYNQIAAAPIQNNSTAPAGSTPAGFNASGLRVGDGKSLLLVGGNVNMDGGQLNAYGGRVELGGLISTGNVGLNVDGDKLSLNFPDSSTRADISLTDGASVRVNSSGGGSIAVNARNLNITGASTLSASTFGQGDAGNVEINARSILLGKGLITATTNSGNGGNINLTAQNSLLLRNGSLISANAGTAQADGNGGNIIVTTPVILAVPNENSDITANAYSGRGGNININVLLLFGIQARPQPSAQTNDITATSQTGAGATSNGQVNLSNSVGIEQTFLLLELPSLSVIESDSRIVTSDPYPRSAQFCQPSRHYVDTHSSYFIIEQGRLRDSFQEIFSGEEALVDLLDLPDNKNTDSTASQNVSTSPLRHIPKASSHPVEIMQARGWVNNGDGTVTLVAAESNVTPHNSALTPASCQTSPQQ